MKKFIRSRGYISYIFAILASLFIMGIMVVCEDIFVHDGMDEYVAGAIDKVVPIAITVLLILYMQGKHMFAFTVRSFFKGLLLGIPFLIYAVVFILETLLSGSTLKAPPLWQISAALVEVIFIGLLEELLFRRFLLGMMLDVSEKRKNVIFSVLLSSLVFASMYISELVLHPNLIHDTIAHMITAFYMGVLMCGLDLLTDNVWVCCVLHTIYHGAMEISDMFVVREHGLVDISTHDAVILDTVTLPLALLGVVYVVLYTVKYRRAAAKSPLPEQISEPIVP